MTSAQGVNANAVAEHAIALILAIARRLPDAPGFIRRADSYSWQQLREAVDLHARALLALGLWLGD